MTREQLALLKTRLDEEYVPHLPALIDTTAPPDHQAAKNTSRSLTAFALRKLTGIDAETAAKAVIDDYDDNGIDGIFYDQSNKRLLLVQSKLRETQPFTQADANAFKTGVIDLLNQRYDRFNRNVDSRKEEIDFALDEADEIQLVVAHASPSISDHASDILEGLLEDGELDDDRLVSTWIDYGPSQISSDLLDEQAAEIINTHLVIIGEKRIEHPRTTYYGRVSLKYLAELYETHGNALFEKNIRFFLGTRSSSVNRAIRMTLQDDPSSFFFLNNGVTALAHTITQRGPRNGGRRYEVEGLSIINGAQTVASSALFMDENPEADISDAHVMLTLIHVEHDDPFGGSVTQARNHQNPVPKTQFAALDLNQERLRRELALRDIVYRYRPEVQNALQRTDSININEAAFALALVHSNPSFPVTLKKESSRFLAPSLDEYQQIFNPELGGTRLANAVRLYRACERVISSNELASSGQEKLIYRHGRYAIIWLLLSRNRAWLERHNVMTVDEARTMISAPLDEIREIVRTNIVAKLATSNKGPLAFFRTLNSARAFLIEMRDELNSL